MKKENQFKTIDVPVKLRIKTQEDLDLLMRMHRRADMNLDDWTTASTMQTVAAHIDTGALPGVKVESISEYDIPDMSDPEHQP